MRVDAVVRNFEVIGEAVKNLSDDIKKQFPVTDWKAIAGFREKRLRRMQGLHRG